MFTHPHVLALEGSDLVPDTLRSHFTLELCKAQQHVQRQAPHAGRGVKALCHRDKGRLSRIKPVDQLREVGQ